MRDLASGEVKEEDYAFGEQGKVVFVIESRKFFQSTTFSLCLTCPKLEHKTRNSNVTSKQASDPEPG